MNHNTDGSKTDFYDIEDCIDLDDLSDHLELTSSEFNVMKSIFGIAIERKVGRSRHNGTNSERDANKLLHYATRIHGKIFKPTRDIHTI